LTEEISLFDERKQEVKNDIIAHEEMSLFCLFHIDDGDSNGIHAVRFSGRGPKTSLEKAD
jgi:hypothetical protein